MNRVVLWWRERSVAVLGMHNPFSRWEKLFRFLDFSVLPFPSPHLNPKNAIVKIDFCPSSFPRGDNSIILPLSTLLPLLPTHTSVYFLFINGAWAAILFRLFIVEKIYNSLDFSFWCRSFHPCRLGDGRWWEVLSASQKCVFRLPFGALSLPSSDHPRQIWQSFLKHLGLGTEFICLIS